MRRQGAGWPGRSALVVLCVGLGALPVSAIAAPASSSEFGCRGVGLLSGTTPFAAANPNGNPCTAAHSPAPFGFSESIGGVTVVARGVQSRTRLIKGARTAVARSHLARITITDDSGDVITARNVGSRTSVTCAASGQHVTLTNTGRVGRLTVNGTTYHPGSAQQQYALRGGLLSINSIAATHFPLAGRSGLTFFPTSLGTSLAAAEADTYLTTGSFTCP